MNLSAPLATLVALATMAASACTSELEEGCIAGPCRADDVPDAGGAGDAGGDDAAAPDAGPNCSETPAPETGDFPCEVHAVLVARCHGCHNANHKMFNAPFPLLTFEDTRPLYGTNPRWQVMKSSIETGFMPLGPEDLTEDELKIMTDWFAACAPPAEGMGCETK